MSSVLSLSTKEHKLLGNQGHFLSISIVLCPHVVDSKKWWFLKINPHVTNENIGSERVTWPMRVDVGICPIPLALNSVGFSQTRWTSISQQMQIYAFDTYIFKQVMYIGTFSG